MIFIHILESHIVGNIGTEKKRENGIYCILIRRITNNKKQEADYMRIIQKLEAGLNQQVGFLKKDMQNFKVTIKMGEKLIKTQNRYFSGGGLYDNKVQGKEIKIGKWIELLDWFSWDSQITINGDYLNGKKVGSWNFFLGQIMNLKMCKFKTYQRGGGTYDFLQEKSIKVGKWKVLNDGFHCQSKVTYHGEYLNNQKAGSWNTYYKRYSKKERIGGGLFDMGIKIGKWIDLDEVFQYDAQIQYIGDYKKGQKVGQWDTYYNNEFQDQRNQKMQITKNPQQWWRNEEIDGNNLGQWIELSDYFNKLQQQNYNGEIYGNQFNSYEIFQSSCNQFKQIGGGLFDEEECGVKIGNWIELIDGFEARQQITYNGKYKNGKKVDGWVKMDIRWNLKLGDLIYDN
ncbi:unnamed protein product [Paramecium octaurelia]|uniref:Uncharacterized protein n=1 Tax=Paramecium octaurelia TaxID=43137 RepID=A0A8S1WN53_PAROT|nr:unnamed protein product [Paramecium octaurelia]